MIKSHGHALALIKDCTRQGQFLVYYQPGKDNLADPFTEHHPPVHIEAMKLKFVHRAEQLANVVIHHLVRGCVNPGGMHRNVHTRVPHVCPRTCPGLSSPKVGTTTNTKIVPAPTNWGRRVAHKVY
jgi:hypothetical protein